MDQSKVLELQNEQTAQKLYTQKLQTRARRPQQYQAPRNTMFTQSVHPSLPDVPGGQLVGRVSLVKPDAQLRNRTDFYIGEQHLNLDGIEVFSWAAPVACTYFRGMNHHEWCHDVAVVRSFLHRAGEIIDFADDVLRADQPSEPFRRRGLTIPARSTTRRLGQRKQAPETTQQTPPAEVRTTDASPTSAIRAEQLLRSQMAAPRTKSLVPVLSTLQPDQYDLVTSPAAGSVLIEGQPGTGKTIIASHRAAWLINQDNAAQGAINTLDGDVLLVGPTDGYVNHVRAVINRLTGNSSRVIVCSVPQLAREIAPGIPANAIGESSYSWKSVDTELGRLALAAIEQLRSALDRAPSAKEAFEYFRANGDDRAPLTTDPEWVSYLGRIPEFRQAHSYKVAEPLLSFVTWQVAPPGWLTNIHHIIVDEAQDVSPLQWLLLRSMNQSNKWTIIGDLNQRRSDHTITSWDDLNQVLDIPLDGLQLRHLERGYRSTKPILEYANRLLSETERELLAFGQVL